MSKSRKILVTGSLGQLGSAIIDAFKDDWVVILTDFVDPGEGKRPANFYRMDISDPVDVKNVIEDSKPDVVLNLAAMTDVDGCETHPEKAKAINEDGVKNILNSFDGKIVQISTDYVFDGTSGPYSEDDEVCPLSVYGSTKLNGEKAVMDSKNDWLIIRTNVLFDYTESTKASFVKWVVDSLKAGKKINIVDDQYGNPTWTVGLADCIRKLLDGGHTGVFNYSGEDYLNRLEFAKKIAEVFDLDATLISSISTAELKQAAKRPLKSGLKTDKVEKLLNLKMLKIEDTLYMIREKLSR